MPIIAEFYGIAVMMFFHEHNPPHFHARYQGKLAVFDIRAGKIIGGKFPPRAQRLVRDWIKLHKKELLANWELALKDRKLKKIKPLE
ncbi:MAG: DUF4160 domain-containing protein [Candidatus Omnitrophica bacterium]|nr:DUF4160 domain-containing protein [Candidatus Omnitrophota bacterium]